jgi:hypothetical protein
MLKFNDVLHPGAPEGGVSKDARHWDKHGGAGTTERPNSKRSVTATALMG